VEGVKDGATDVLGVVFRAVETSEVAIRVGITSHLSVMRFHRTAAPNRFFAALKAGATQETGLGSVSGRGHTRLPRRTRRR
jgi:hypothetical protein